VDELVAKLTNTCRHEGGKVHCNIAHRCQVSATKIAEECDADHSKQLPGHDTHAANPRLSILSPSIRKCNG